MSNIVDNPNTNTDLNGSDMRHYILLTVAIIIGIVGVYFRFAGDSFFYTSVSNIILVIGIIIALKAVFSIMK